MLKATWFILAGMAIVFATLSLIVLMMMALNRWLPPEAKAGVERRGAGDA